MSAAATSETHQAYISLGSNIDAEQNLRAALEALRQRVQLTALSTAWRSAAVGAPGPDFLNAAAGLRTELDAGDLKQDVLLPIENELGRVRSSDPNAPRTIDLDILVFDGAVLDPELWHQAHLAVPLAEIGLTLRQADTGYTLQEVADQLQSQAALQPQSGVVD